jgi:hypothetical protein
MEEYRFEIPYFGFPNYIPLFTPTFSTTPEQFGTSRYCQQLRRKNKINLRRNRR